MANLTDAFGTFYIDKVAKEFIEFINAVQGGAYYVLIDAEDLREEEITSDGSLQAHFSTSGRWAYENNIDGYLRGNWLTERESGHKEAYDKFIKALIEKNGRIEIEYKDSDPAMDWMGEGTAVLEVIDGEESYSCDFGSEPIVLSKFAEMNGESEYWALEYLHGEEVSALYDKYVEQWKKDHRFKKGEEEPAGPSEWYDNDFNVEDLYASHDNVITSK